MPASHVRWGQWKVFLSQYFNSTVKGLKGFHYFRVCKDHSGTVFCREHHDSQDEKPFNLLRTPVEVTAARLHANWRSGLRSTAFPIPSLDNHEVKEKTTTTGGIETTVTTSRRDYLVKEVAKPLQEAEPNIVNLFFEDGSQAVSSEPNYRGSLPLPPLPPSLPPLDMSPSTLSSPSSVEQPERPSNDPAHDPINQHINQRIPRASSLCPRPPPPPPLRTQPYSPGLSWGTTAINTPSPQSTHHPAPRPP